MDKTLSNYSGLTEIGTKPDGRYPRWARWTQGDLKTLPPVKSYTCLRTSTPITVDGRLNEEVWSQAKWTESFARISDGAQVPLETKIALLWDDDYLYAGYKIEDPDIRGSMTGFHDHVYQYDEDVEIFVHGDGYYFELGVNPVNNIYELFWTWIEPLVKAHNYAELERVLKTPNYLYYIAREGEPIGRHGDLDWVLPGLKHAVSIDGSLNNPEIADAGWTVEFALPWEGLRPIAGGLNWPPKPGDTLKITAYRAHHTHHPDGTSRSEGWTWSIMGNDNIHIPERWTRVEFSDQTV